MSDIKLFRLQSDRAFEMQGDASHFEKPLQTLMASLEGHVLSLGDDCNVRS